MASGRSSQDSAQAMASSHSVPAPRRRAPAILHQSSRNGASAGDGPLTEGAHGLPRSRGPLDAVYRSGLSSRSRRRAERQVRLEPMPLPCGPQAYVEANRPVRRRQQVPSRSVTRSVVESPPIRTSSSPATTTTRSSHHVTFVDQSTNGPPTPREQDFILFPDDGDSLDDCMYESIPVDVSPDAKLVFASDDCRPRLKSWHRVAKPFDVEETLHPCPPTPRLEEFFSEDTIPAYPPLLFSPVSEVARPHRESSVVVVHHHHRSPSPA